MRAVEYGRFEAHGEAATQEVDVRVIAATGIDLPSAVMRGEFRADLLDRLAFDVITLPPLRVRPDDILPLSEFFGRKIAAELGANSFPGFTSEAIEIMRARPWPGNVRELKAVVERNTARAWLADEALVEPLAELSFDPFEGPHRLRDRAPGYTQQSQNTATPPYGAPMPAYGLPPMVDGQDSTMSRRQNPAQAAPQGGTLQPTPLPIPLGFKDRVFRFERQIVDEALRACNGHQGKAAERLDMSYHAFRGLLRKHGLKK